MFVLLKGRDASLQDGPAVLKADKLLGDIQSHAGSGSAG
jgi:hypothetical protein